MKIVCTQENLKLGLTTTGRIISSNTSLPILNNLMLKTENSMLKISSTNLEVGITTHIRCKVEEEGAVTISSKTITELVNNLPNQNLTLMGDNSQLLVETENYHTTIKTLPIDDFPLIPSIEQNQNLEIDTQQLKNSLDQVSFAVSLNQTQPEISGVLFSFEGKILKIVATDRYRLAEKLIDLSKTNNSNQQIIIPHKTINELSRIIGTQKGNVELSFTETQACFKVDNTEIISRLVDGQYPDYKQIIPQNFATIIIVEKQDLLGALKASGVFSQAGNSVKFVYEDSNQTLKLITESQDLGKSEIELQAKIAGKSGAVLLNHHYIIDCLGGMNTKNIVMKIINESSPSLLLAEGQNDYLYLVMPIKS